MVEKIFSGPEEFAEEFRAKLRAEAGKDLKDCNNAQR